MANSPDGGGESVSGGWLGDYSGDWDYGHGTYNRGTYTRGSWGYCPPYPYHPAIHGAARSVPPGALEVSDNQNLAIFIIFGLT